MNLQRWGAFSAVLAAALVGCQQSASEKIQEKQEDVVEAEQDLRKEEAELNAAEREAREEQPADEGGPILTLPPSTTTDEPEGVTAPASDEGNADPLSEDVPSEGAPQAGTSAEGTGDPPAPSLGGEAGSAGEEAGSDEADSAPPL